MRRAPPRRHLPPESAFSGRHSREFFRPSSGFLRCAKAKAISRVLVGVWLSPVEHCVRDAGVAGSNPATPTSFLALSHHYRDSYRDRYALLKLKEALHVASS